MASNLASKVTQLWQMQPVQFGLKSFAAGSAVAASLYVFKKFSGLSSDVNDAVRALVEVMPQERDSIQFLSEHEPEFIELLARLLVFRNFAKDVYFDIFHSMFYASEARNTLYETEHKLSAKSSFYIRRGYQTIIEHVRVFRSILEQRMPTALEDFDEIAVDINGKVEQACTDAIQDSVL
jgi:hypothetical protein